MNVNPGISADIGVRNLPFALTRVSALPSMTARRDDLFRSTWHNGSLMGPRRAETYTARGAVRPYYPILTGIIVNLYV